MTRGDFYVAGSNARYPDVEAAITAARTIAHAAGMARDFYGSDGILGQVWPDGQVDMTWLGSGIVPAQRPP